MRSKNIYVADFETSTNPDRTYVWGWAMCSVNDIDKVSYGSSITSFIDTIKKLKNNSIVYFHNLSFDGSFILNYLIDSEYRQDLVNNNIAPMTFNTTVSSAGQWYSIHIRFAIKNIYIMDSLKKLPFSVKQIAKSLGYELKGEIDYDAERLENGVLSEEDKDYMRRDVQIVARALDEMFFKNKLYGQTIGSDCLKYYKRMQPRFNEYFPKLSPEVDEFCRNAYRGGYCYVNPKIQGKTLKTDGITYDYNSMYPSVMHSNSGYLYPIGEPFYYTGVAPDDCLYIQHIRVHGFSLLENKMPSIQIKKTFRYKETEYISFTDETVDLYLTSVDLDLFLENYAPGEIEYIDGYAFAAVRGVFDDYIDHWYRIKEKSTEKGDKVMRQLSKLFLNNLYGKFGQSKDASKKEFRLEEEVLKNHDIPFEKDTLYVPVAAFITAYARRELFNAIYNNLKNFCYCDTDSVHLIGKTANGLKVDDAKLGCWKKESDWTEAKFLRAKTYVEKIDGKYEYKAAGMPDEVKKHIEFDEFDIGAVFSGKLMKKQTKGGAVLVETTFKILDV